MKTEQLISLLDIVSFIVGIVSIVLAIVSLVLSILFYKWGAKASKESSRLSTNIEAHTKYLKDLFDQMLKTTFEMIREHNQTMDRRFLNLPGETELKRQSKIDIDIFGDFINHDSLKLSDLASKYDVNVKIIEEVIKDISKRGVLVLEIDGEYAKVVKRAATNGQATETEVNGSNDDCGSNF